jgi:biopolymer transport protein ExbD
MLPKHNKPTLVRGVRSDINVTPLVDVCLVLLIIFMVVTPMLQKGVDVSLPATANPTKMPENAKQLTMAIRQDGSIFVNQNWVPKENLKGTLAEVHTSTPDKDVIIKADRRLKYKDVRSLMQFVNEAGFSHVGLVTEKRKRSSSMAMNMGNAGSVRSEINITPLVDVVLVLLIIFMIAVPLLQMGYSAQVPPKIETATPPPSEDQIIVRMDSTGATFINKQLVPYAEFGGALKSALTGRQQKVVFFAADGDLPFDKVVDFMDVVRNSGAENLGIVFDDLKNGGAPATPGAPAAPAAP